MVLLGFIYCFIFLTLYIVNVVSKQHVYIIFIEKKTFLKQHGVKELPFYKNTKTNSLQRRTLVK